MDKVETKKRLAIERIAEDLLLNGLNDTGIRRLAKAAGTSDRMLIYYFGTKDELINQTLGWIADGFTMQLDALMDTHIRTEEVLLAELTVATAQPAFRPAIQLWFELVGLAARGKEPYISNARTLGMNWVRWIESRIEEPSEAKAKDLYAHLEGRIMLRLIDIEL